MLISLKKKSLTFRNFSIDIFETNISNSVIKFEMKKTKFPHQQFVFLRACIFPQKRKNLSDKILVSFAFMFHYITSNTNGTKNVSKEGIVRG